MSTIHATAILTPSIWRNFIFEMAAGVFEQPPFEQLAKVCQSEKHSGKTWRLGNHDWTSWTYTEAAKRYTLSMIRKHRIGCILIARRTQQLIVGVKLSISSADQIRPTCYRTFDWTSRTRLWMLRGIEDKFCSLRSSAAAKVQ